MLKIKKFFKKKEVRKKNSLKEKIKKTFNDIFYPFVFLFDFLLTWYKATIHSIKDNKQLVIMITYWLWLFLQCLFLLISFWIEWLNYISIKFSLVLLFIIGFLGILWLPLIIIILIIYILFIFFWLWWLFVILIWLSFIFRKTIGNKLDQKKLDKFNNFLNKSYFIYVVFIVIMFWIIFISQYSITKPVEIITKHWKILWDLNFYNQDYYFLDNCNQKIVIPENEVVWVNYLCPVLSCKQEDLDKIKKFKEFKCKILKAPKILIPIKK